MKYAMRNCPLNILVLLLSVLAFSAPSLAEGPAVRADSLADQTAKSGADTLSIEVSGLVCEFCARGLEKSFKKNKKEQVLNISVDMDSSVVSIDLTAGAEISDKDIRKIINDNGLSVVKIDRGKSSK